MAIQLERIASETADAESSVKLYRIFSYPADFTLSVLYEKWNSGELIVPEFQRKFVWSANQASKLIESFLLGLPVPEIFLYNEPSQKQIIIDGQQRLKSIFFFFDGAFPDGRTFRLTDVNARWLGKTYEELDEADQRRLRNSVLRSIFVEQVDPKDKTSVYHVFQRLNTGGTSLTPQEVRNCVYHGPFNDLLMQLNENATWRELVGSPQPDKRMRDVELIARFLALAERHRSYTKPMKDFISDYMQEYQNSTAHGRFEKLFASTVKRVVEHLGPRPFHIKRGLNAAAFDSVMVAFASKTNGVPRDVRARYNRLLKDKPFVEATTAGTTDESVVESRIARAQAVLFE